MAAYRRFYDSRHLQADCQEPGSAPEPYARQLSMGYLLRELTLTDPQEVDPVMRRVHWSRASAPRRDWLQRNQDGRCSVGSEHTHSNSAELRQLEMF